PEVPEAVAPESIRARADDRVDAAAGRLAELRHEARLGDLEFLNGVRGDVAGDAGPAACLREVGLVVVVAFDGEVVEHAGLAAVAQETEAPVARDAGRQERELI